MLVFYAVMYQHELLTYLYDINGNLCIAARLGYLCEVKDPKKKILLVILLYIQENLYRMQDVL